MRYTTAHFVNSFICPAPYAGAKIPYILVEKVKDIFGDVYPEVYFVDEMGNECSLTGIPFGAYWEAEVISEYDFADTAEAILEEMNFHGGDREGQEFLLELRDELDS